MPLILAIEPDRRQAAQLSVVVRKRVQAELILVDTTERALDAIGNRMPDLVLVPALLSPQDDAALAAALRVIAAAARVQMLTIPVLGTPRPAPASGGVLSALRRGKSRAAEPDGCDPAVFAEQIASYLERAAEERPASEVVAMPPADPPPPVEQAAVEAVAIVEDATRTVEDARTVEETISPEWLEPLSAENDVVVEPVNAAAPDEGVSLALEEAVRALFADPAPIAVDSPPVVAEPVESGPELAIGAVNEAEKDEWVTVEGLIAALQLMPHAALEVTSEGDWIAPVPNEPQRVAEKPQRVAEKIEHRVDGPGGSDIDRTKEVSDGHGRSLAAVSPSPPAARSEREWVALIESLRHDVERLRVERSEKPGRKAVPAKAARPDRAAKPVQDEWGFFDPQQCGFAALLAKLDEVTDSDDGRINR